MNAFQAKFASFVGESHGTKDTSIKDLETGYETRIAELIVTHENRVQELENAANDRVQKELERVEMEFERDRDRLAEIQAKKLAALETAHESTMERLEAKLSKAEKRAKEAVDKIKEMRNTHDMSSRQLRADLEAQLNAARIAINELGTNGGSQVRGGMGQSKHVHLIL